jgi:hypothetical protein
LLGLFGRNAGADRAEPILNDPSVLFCRLRWELLASDLGVAVILPVRSMVFGLGRELLRFVDNCSKGLGLWVSQVAAGCGFLTTGGFYRDLVLLTGSLWSNDL